MQSSGYSPQGEALDIHAARPEEHRALYEAFAGIVARGEGFPQDPAGAAPRAEPDIDDPAAEQIAIDRQLIDPGRPAGRAGGFQADDEMALHAC